MGGPIASRHVSLSVQVMDVLCGMESTGMLFPSKVSESSAMEDASCAQEEDSTASSDELVALGSEVAHDADKINNTIVASFKMGRRW
jgi:hypothetical protein